MVSWWIDPMFNPKHAEANPGCQSESSANCRIINETTFSFKLFETSTANQNESMDAYWMHVHPRSWDIWDANAKHLRYPSVTCYLFTNFKNMGVNFWSRLPGRFDMISFWQHASHPRRNQGAWPMSTPVIPESLKLLERVSTTNVDLCFKFLHAFTKESLDFEDHISIRYIKIHQDVQLSFGFTKIRSLPHHMVLVPTSFEDGRTPLKAQLPQLCGEQRFWFLR